MRNYLLTGVAAVALVGFVAPQANATAVTTNTWYEFGFNTASGSPLISGVGFAPLMNAPPPGEPDRAGRQPGLDHYQHRAADAIRSGYVRCG
jgi:hypothetical protein